MADNRILDVVAGFATNGKTGTVMAVFEDNSLGRFYLAGGVLATARYRSKQGRAALEVAVAVNVTSAKFHENADLVRSGELIDGVSISGMNSSASTSPASLQPASVASSGGGGPPLTHVMRSGLGELLSEFIGPVAPLIMSDLSDNVDVDTAIEYLSKEIQDATAAANFVKKARAITS
jgi:hypothetical protein